MICLNELTNYMIKIHMNDHLNYHIISWGWFLNVLTFYKHEHEAST